MLCAITDVRVHAIVMRMFLIARPLRFGARGGVVAALPKVRLAMGAGQAKRDLRSRGPVRQIFVCCRHCVRESPALPTRLFVVQFFRFCFRNARALL